MKKRSCFLTCLLFKMDDRRKIFIRNISYYVTAELLKKIFNEIDDVDYAYVLYNENRTAIVKFKNEYAVPRAIATFDKYWLHGRRIHIEKYDTEFHFDYLVHFLESKRTIPLKERSKPPKHVLNYLRKKGIVWKPLPQRSPSLKLVCKAVMRDWRGTEHGKIIGGYYAQPKKDNKN